jgi:hypothetical protein
MIQTKLFRSPLNPIFPITWILVSLIGYPEFLLAQPHESSDRSSEPIPIHFMQANQDPPDRGTPPASEGTGSRGDCLYKQQRPPLTGLVGSKHLQLTIKTHPTFWVYVPYTLNEATSGEFSLQDGDNDVYRTRFQLPKTPGVVSITLPIATKPLEVGKVYRWYFDINCPHAISSSEVTPASVTGLVKRVTLSENLERELKAAKTPLERIAIYAKYGIWYETLTELAQMRLHEPNNPTVKNAWVDLLGQSTVGLGRFSQEAIAGSVK